MRPIIVNVMLERPFELPTTPPFRIYGLYNQAGDEPSDRLVILLHGLTGFITEYMHITAAHRFAAEGYDVLRPAFYSSEEDARRFEDCTLAEHVADLNTILDAYAPAYKEIYICGHSYGGMTAMMANPDITAVSLWDSSLYPYVDYWERETRWSDRYQVRVYDYGYLIPAGEEMVKDAARYTLDVVEKAARAMKARTQLVISGAHVDRPGQRQAFSFFPDPKRCDTIEDADHDFVNLGTMDKLLDVTLDWFENG